MALGLILWWEITLNKVFNLTRKHMQKTKPDGHFAANGPKEMSFFTRCEIQGAINRIDALLKCGIFTQQNSQHILFRAAFIELLITLRDLMYKTGVFSSRISFVDDVSVSKEVKDISDLVRVIRDAICHPDSPNHYLDGTKSIMATFNVAFGRASLLKTGDYEQSSSYEDDVCFFFGPYGIYMNRHIIRAFEEARSKLLPLLEHT